MSSPSIQRVHVPLPLMVTRKPEVFALSNNAYCFLPLSVVSAATIQYDVAAAQAARLEGVPATTAYVKPSESRVTTLVT